MNYQKTGKKHKNYIESFWNDHIMERFIKANLFIICCVAAGLLLIVYLGAFSCEVSWILEARGDLPISAYILCTQYFIVFVATTILIHGLVTGLSWGLFAWSVVIGLLSIPELIFVMIMTTQHWGLQSVVGLTELISYLVRLVINCFALICVIPTGIRWRRETQVLSQLQDLATRLQLQTPPPSVPPPPITKADSRRSSKRLSPHTHAAFENAGYQVSELSAGSNLHMVGSPTHGLNLHSAGTGNHSLFGSQNEFNASAFGATPYMLQFDNGMMAGRNGGAGSGNGANRAQSLMDLRCTLPGMYNPRYVLESDDKNGGKYFNITIDDLKSSIKDSPKNQTPSLIGSVNDPIYCSIEPKQLQHQQQQQQQHNQQQTPPPQQHRQRSPNGAKAPQPPTTKLSRNCISLENLDGITKVQNDLNGQYGPNLLQNYTQQQQQYYLAMLSGYLQPQRSNLHMYRRPSGSDVVDGGGPFANAMMTSMVGQAPLQRRGSQQLQYYGGFGYANYTNPYITANSKLSLGNESDDYRKYRDVAL